MMIHSNWKIALRNIQRQRVTVFINIAGLALGMSVCFLIMLWVLEELSYDRYHKHAERIYRVCIDLEAGSHMSFPYLMPAAVPVMRQEFPEIINAVRIGLPRRIAVRYEDRSFQEDLVVYADFTLFEIFTLPFIKGDPNTALKAPHTIVITETMADKYFGDEEPLGKMLKLDDNDVYAVTGVVKDVPRNSHFRFHMIRSFETLYVKNRKDMENWFNIQYFTYLLLKENTAPPQLEKKFPSFIDRHMGEMLKSMGGSLTMFLQPLTHIHLHSRFSSELSPNGDINQIILFSCIALFVLVIACINFINLSTARSATRVQEIGIRKTLGARRDSLIAQFLGESVIYSFIAMALAVFLTLSIMPIYNTLLDHTITINTALIPWLLMGCFGFACFIGLFAGSYPAFYLSSFQPVRIVRNGGNQAASNSRFRKILVVIQFAISILLIIPTIAIDRQIHFMKNSNLGFSEEHIIIIPGVNRLLERRSFRAIQEELTNLPDILDVAGSSFVPSQGIRRDIFYPEGMADNAPQTLNRMEVDPHYIPTMEIELIAGRNFSPMISTDPDQSLIINETATKMLGWKDPIGKTLRLNPRPGREDEIVTMKVIGVVKDFHWTSFQEKIAPLVMLFHSDQIRYMAIRIGSKNISRTVNSLKRLWQKIDPGRPMDYYFLDDSFDHLYQTEERLGRLILYFSIFAITIGCLGLFGLSAFIAERRTKEIGIRKVLGASVPGILRMISGEFILLVLIANIIAWPLAYYSLNGWLNNFAYRIDIHIWMFFLAGLLALIVALLAIGLQATKAALANPVDAIMYE